MPLKGIHVGDIIEVDKKGRRFHAMVRDRSSDGKGLTFMPLCPNVSYRTCTAHEVVEHWRRRRTRV